MRTRNKTISLRISSDLRARLDAACKRRVGPFKVTVTAIVERGLELALKELARKAKDYRRG